MGIGLPKRLYTARRDAMGLAPSIKFDRPTYAARLIGIDAANLIRYWKLNEAAGTTGAGSVLDYSGLGGHATPTGVTFGSVGIGDGQTGATFDGSTSRVNVYSAALNSAFDPNEFTLSAWALVSNWTSAEIKYIMYIAGTHGAGIYQNAATGQLSFLYNTTSAKSISPTGLSYASWFHVALTVSKAADEMKAYINGSQVGTTLTGLGAWSGALSSNNCLVGAAWAIPLNVWNGRIAHAAIWKTPLSAANILKLATV